MLRTAFQETGCPVETAETAEEGLALLRRQGFDLLLTDKNLPGMSGVDLIKKVREYDKKLPIILMTAYATAQSVKDTMHLEVTAYLEKPFDDVMAVVRLAADIASRPKPPDPVPEPRRPTPSQTGRQTVTVLLASADQKMWGAMAEPIDGTQARIEYAGSPPEVLDMVERIKPQVIVLHATAYADVASLAARVRELCPDVSSAVLSPEELPIPTLKRLIDLQVSGVFDRTADDTYKQGINALVQRAKYRVRR